MDKIHLGQVVDISFPVKFKDVLGRDDIQIVGLPAFHSFQQKFAVGQALIGVKIGAVAVKNKCFCLLGVDDFVEALLNQAGNGFALGK